MSDWKTPAINANCAYEGEGTYRPVYLSMDWGQSWMNLDNESLPDYLTISTLHISATGNVYLASANAGIFKIDDISKMPDILSVDENSSTEKFVVYPNPSKGIFTVRGASIANIRIYNLNGVLIQQTYSNNYCDLSQVPNGVYFAKITDKNGNTSTQKMIKF